MSVPNRHVPNMLEVLILSVLQKSPSTIRHILEVLNRSMRGNTSFNPVAKALIRLEGKRLVSHKKTGPQPIHRGPRSKVFNLTATGTNSFMKTKSVLVEMLTH